MGWMFVLLIVLLICVPLAELYLIVQVGGLIGVWPTLLLLLATSLIGGLLLRHQGRAAWRAFSSTIQDGRVPARETFDGALVIGGGVLLLTPGFLTDLFGLLLLLPPTRAVFRSAGQRLAGRSRFGFATRFDGARFRPPPRSGGPKPGDIEGTAQEIVDEPGLPAGPGGVSGDR